MAQAFQAFKMRGGARIGWVSASWPLASIEVTPGSITLVSMGTYTFSPNEVTAVEEVGSIPLLSKGIRIHHTKAGYPERIVFFSASGRESAMAAIGSAGFSLGKPVTQPTRGFPFRVPAVVAVVLAWNLLFFLDQPNFEEKGRFGPFVLAALAMLFVLSTLLPRSTRLQKLFLRDGRHIGEIQSLLRLLQLISGFMLLAFGIGFVASDA